MCHMAMTYECITPFLKGLHLTLASYLPQRDSEGWKLSDKQWLAMVDEWVEEGKMTREEAQSAIEEEKMAQKPETEWLSYVLSRLEAEDICEEEAQAALDQRPKTGDPPPQLPSRGYLVCWMIWQP
jgi:polyhydroxyalkanoate synthesis regulator phasin